MRHRHRFKGRARASHPESSARANRSPAHRGCRCPSPDPPPVPSFPCGAAPLSVLAPVVALVRQRSIRPGPFACPQPTAALRAPFAPCGDAASQSLCAGLRREAWTWVAPARPDAGRRRGRLGDLLPTGGNSTIRASIGFISGSGGAVCLSRRAKPSRSAVQIAIDNGAIQTSRRHGSSRNGEAV